MATQVKPTAEYHDRAAWLEARRKVVGGSDAGAVCGKDPFKTALDVYHDKVSPVVDAPPNPDMLRGNLYEAIAVDLFVEKTGRTLRRQPMRINKQHPFMAISMDRQQVNDPRGPGYAEVKCPSPQVFRRIWAEGLPDRHILQLQHGLEVTGYEWGTFIVYDCVRPTVLFFDVERDPDVGARLVEIEGEFMQHVENKEPPPVEGLELDILLSKVEGEVLMRTDPEWTEAIASMAKAKQLLSTAKDLDALSKEMLIELMGGDTTPQPHQGGGYRVYYTLRDGRAQHAQTIKAIERLRPLDPMKVVGVVEGALRFNPQECVGRAQHAQKGGVIHSEWPSAEQIAGWLADCVLDLDALKKVGKSYAHFQAYPLKVEAETE